MLKLKQMKEKQTEKKTEETKATSSTPSTTEGEGNKDGKEVLVLNRQSSKELLDHRRQKSKESSVFTLKTNTGKNNGKKKKQNGAELRAHKDISEMQQIPGTKLEFPNPDNLMLFNLFVTPTDGLYKGAEFKFIITVPQDYPYSPPKASCETPIYHPNIDTEGHVCLNILRAEWMPVLNLGAVVFGIVTLFLEPNPDDPLNKVAAQTMVSNRSLFEKNVKTSLQGGFVEGRQYQKLIK